IPCVPTESVSISQIGAMLDVETRKYPGAGGTRSRGSVARERVPRQTGRCAVELGSVRERNKERCREDRERPSLDEEKKPVPDSQTGVRPSLFPIWDQSAIFGQAYRLSANR